jgi:hypothetical protein
VVKDDIKLMLMILKPLIMMQVFDQAK